MKLLESIERVDGSDSRVLVLAAAYTGLRWGELAGLKVSDIDFLRRRLTVRRTLSEVSGRLIEGEPKTASARRTVALPGFLTDELAPVIDHDRRYVFTAPAGGPLRRSNFRRRVWLPATADAELTGLRFHDLRHTHAAMLIALGDHPKVVQSRLGHLFEGLDGAAADRLVAPVAHAPVAPSPRPERSMAVNRLRS